mmetsp:Transcript_1220/g.1908  ORF Transcript_1220/g.1908 Transcript_1220/m.1908 type:complete len:716 (-) Transcript_1220:66-2213(-)
MDLPSKMSDSGQYTSLKSSHDKISLRTMYEDCSLIEIVHFHECLRRELQSLINNVILLRKQAAEIERNSNVSNEEHFELELQVISQFQIFWAVFQSHSTAEDEFIWPALKDKASKTINTFSKGINIAHIFDEIEYAEEHSEENQIFQNIEALLKELRAARKEPKIRAELLKKLESQTVNSFHFLKKHLQKEETSALPLIKEFFSAVEIEVIVGKIMGKRSSELMKTILSMMIKNLHPGDVGQMMGYIKQAVKDTYFEKWLASGGFTWDGLNDENEDFNEGKKRGNCELTQDFGSIEKLEEKCDSDSETNYLTDGQILNVQNVGSRSSEPLTEVEFQATVRRLVRIRGMSMERKSSIIQALRSNMYQNIKRARIESKNDGMNLPKFSNSEGNVISKEIASNSHAVKLSAPHKYYSGDSVEPVVTGDIPLFPVKELSQTWKQSHNLEEIGILGCPHYSRRVKLRAPCCDRLFTCRLCHDHEMDHVMDRYKVSEMLCMLCESLQPISNRCRDIECQIKNAKSKELSKYYCQICHLHDDDQTKNIYHCPYCNICRRGKGLGEDFCHCMKCNACISVQSAKSHSCVTHSLEGKCPICSVGMFTSTQQVKGLKCGHFMHLNCYRESIRHAERASHWYRCPICLRSMDDMAEYFGQLDAVVKAQPMPTEFENLKAKVLCHDCNEFTTVSYHFCYLKCGECGSYNTRMEELLSVSNGQSYIPP